MNTKRFLLAAVLITAGCAHSPERERTPANVDAKPEIEDPNANMFRNGAVAKAFLLSEPNQKGERRPLCQYSVHDHQELVPRFTTPAVGTFDQTFGLKECTVPQLNKMAEVAAAGNRPAVASLGWTAMTCVFDFGMAIAFTTNQRKAMAELKLPADRIGTTAVTAVGAGGTAAMSAALKANFSHAPVIVTTVCMGAGAAVGYWFVPKANL